MTAIAPRSRGTDDLTSAWVVCLGEIRDVRRGMVVCPLRGRRVPLDRCLVCHHLADVSDERERAAPCAMGLELG